ncbi:FkbM family methyltransferase [Oleidesulfovibrio sp.]|uniref:FkbM family methyltransferase n=1 Tax=Oleidesulfovibrio sp. TaxID=2909707 RepID=UPI003A84A0DF
MTRAAPDFILLTHRYKEHVLRLTVPTGEAFLIGDVFVRNEYPLTRLKGVFRNPVVVDIGANVGLFSLYIHLNIPAAIIHSFEPSASLCGAMRANLAGCANVHVHSVALADHDGQACLHLNTSKAGQSSLKDVSAEQAAGWVDEEVCVRDAGTMFDELGIDSVDILKLDTEGSEIEILQSMGHRLEAVKHMFVEYHSDADLSIIRTLLENFTELSHDRRGEGVGVLRLMHKRFC